MLGLTFVVINKWKSRGCRRSTVMKWLAVGVGGVDDLGKFVWGTIIMLLITRRRR